MNYIFHFNDLYEGRDLAKTIRLVLGNDPIFIMIQFFYVALFAFCRDLVPFHRKRYHIITLLCKKLSVSTGCYYYVLFSVYFICHGGGLGAGW